MKAGTASMVITPPVGIVLGGNGRKDNKSRGVHDNLYANIIILSNSDSVVVFIGLDLGGISGNNVSDMKNLISKRYNIEDKDIVVCATHTHSGPNVIKVFESLYSTNELAEIDAYLKDITDKIVDGVGGAMSDMFECKFGFGDDIVEGYSFNRRIMLKDGSLKMVFEEYDYEDVDCIAGPNGYPAMNVFKITDLNSKIKGIIVNYTSHPATACGEGMLYSRDYINALTNDLKRNYGNDVVILFANGSEGNMVAANPYKPFVTGFDESDRVGHGLAKAVIEIADCIELKDEIEIKTIVRKINLPIRKISEEEVMRAKKILMTMNDQDIVFSGMDPRVEADSIIKLSKYNKEYEATVIQTVILNDIIIVTFPGEVFIEYGLDVIKNSPYKKTVIFGLANDFIGYIPTKKAFSEGGYEIKHSFISSKLAEDAGEIFVQEVKKFINDVFIRED